MASFGNDETALDQESESYTRLVQQFGSEGVRALAAAKFGGELLQSSGVARRFAQMETQLDQARQREDAWRAQLNDLQQQVAVAQNQAAIALNPKLKELQEFQWDLHNSMQPKPDGTTDGPGKWLEVMEAYKLYKNHLAANPGQLPPTELAARQADATGIRGGAPPAGAQAAPGEQDLWDEAERRVRARMAGNAAA
jgi:hypothetical protein